MKNSVKGAIKMPLKALSQPLYRTEQPLQALSCLSKHSRNLSNKDGTTSTSPLMASQRTFATSLTRMEQPLQALSWPLNVFSQPH
jgi:hypothetical protein